MGRVTAGLTSCLASPGAAAFRSESIPIPAPMPKAPATGATYSHFFIIYPPERVIRPSESECRGKRGSYPTRRCRTASGWGEVTVRLGFRLYR